MKCVWDCRIRQVRHPLLNPDSSARTGLAPSVDTSNPPARSEPISDPLRETSLGPRQLADTGQVKPSANVTFPETDGTTVGETDT